MEAYLIYAGKTAIAAAAFYLAFLVLFQNRTHFVFNRLYLPSAMLMSYIIPLITFTVTEYVEAPAATINSFALLSSTAENPVSENSMTWWPHYLFMIYILGAAGFLFHLIAGHVNALQIIRRSRIEWIYGSYVHITSRDVHPFSFFNKIIVSQKSLDKQGLRMIIEHERFHCQQKHTYDILFTEILFLLQWFNPFAWLIRSAVKDNLEYQTDAEIITHHNPVNYQMAMVAQADKEGVAPFLTALNGSQLRNRIIMMKKKHSNRHALVKQFVVLPLLAVLVMGLADREVMTEWVPAPGEIKQDVLPSTGNIKISGRIVNEEGEPLPGVSVIVKGKPEGTITGNDGKFLIERADEKESLLFIHEGYVTQEIAPGDLNHVDVTLKRDKAFQIKQDTVSATNRAGTFKVKSDVIIGDDPLYVVDGVISRHINQVPPHDIESIDVMKGKSATDLYGAKGENGVISIKTKSKSYAYLNDDAQNVRPQPQEQFEVPDEWPQFPGGDEAMHKFIAENIRYPESARENGIQGDVYVSFKVTKAGKLTDVKVARGIHPPLDQEAKRVVGSMPDWKPAITDGEPVELSPVAIPVKFVIKDPVVKVTSYSKSLAIPGPLYIVDGVETTTIKDINPDDIKHIDVLKSGSATALYGHRGKDGVIIISTQQNEPDKQIRNVYEMRQFIAKNIKYPVEAQKAGLVGRVSVTIDPGKSNRIVRGQVLNSENTVFVDDVIVVGYTVGNGVEQKTEGDLSLLVKEAERVIGMLPQVKLPGTEDKLLNFNVQFNLQTDN